MICEIICNEQTKMSAEKIGTETKSLEDRMNNLVGKPVLEKSLLDDILEERLKKMGHDLRELGKDRRILIEEGDYLFKSETFLNYYGRVSIRGYH